MTRGPSAKGKVLAFYGENRIDVATEADLIRLTVDEPAKARYLTPDGADALAELLRDSARIVRARWKRDGR